MKPRLVIKKCAVYTFWQLFLRRLYLTTVRAPSERLHVNRKLIIDIYNNFHLITYCTKEGYIEILSFHYPILISSVYILFKKTTAVKNEVTFSYHRLHGLYFLAVAFVATIFVLQYSSPCKNMLVCVSTLVPNNSIMIKLALTLTVLLLV